jgi:ribonucleoside-diphosphate reductase alpha chain
MRPASPFTAVAAVEAWDAWFRWRDASGLRDRTIEATWWRVARSAAAAEGAQAEAWARRFFDAFATWRLLPDALMLRAAGTGALFLPDEVLRATLDACAFIAGSGLDLERIADTAALAIRLLDDALLALCPERREHTGLRVGLLGVGDALKALGVPYDSDAARRLAGDVAAALARGARRGAREVARERDPDRTTTRLTRVTAIGPQPQLACFANCASDALDPVPAELEAAGPLAQLRLRATMQPWIDEPIAYPLRAAQLPADADANALAGFARDHGLAPPVVQRLVFAGVV